MQCEKFYHFAISVNKNKRENFYGEKKNNDDFAEVSIFCENTRE